MKVVKDKSLALGERLEIEDGLTIGVCLPDLPDADRELLAKDPLKELDHLTWSGEVEGVEVAVLPLHTVKSTFEYDGESYTREGRYQFTYIKIPRDIEYDEHYVDHGMTFVKEQGVDGIQVSLEYNEMTYEVLVYPDGSLELVPDLISTSKIVKKVKSKPQVVTSIDRSFDVSVHYVDRTGKNLRKREWYKISVDKPFYPVRHEIEGYEYVAGMNFINSWTDETVNNDFLLVEDSLQGHRRFTVDFKEDGEEISKGAFAFYIDAMNKVDPKRLLETGFIYLIYDEKKEH